jgi:hypothetical protein
MRMCYLEIMGKGGFSQPDTLSLFERGSTLHFILSTAFDLVLNCIIETRNPRLCKTDVKAVLFYSLSRKNKYIISILSSVY